MKSKRKKRKSGGCTLAYIKWFDASFQVDECMIDELNPGVVMESAGIIVREDRDSISIALDVYKEHGIFRRILHIPKPYILKIKRFKA